MNVIVCGVGGQGLLLASEVLAQAALRAGYDVKKSEVHGMAQRGGSVVSHVRYGAAVQSPLIPEGQADAAVALEELEAMRYAHLVRPEGWMVVNDLRHIPSGVLTGRGSYPADPLGYLRRRVAHVLVIPCWKLAEELGDPRVQNVIALGALSRLLDLEVYHWRAALKTLIKPRYLSINLRAFRAGRRVVPS